MCWTVLIDTRGAHQSSSVQTYVFCPSAAPQLHICRHGWSASGLSLGLERVLKGNKQIYGLGAQALTPVRPLLQED